MRSFLLGLFVVALCSCARPRSVHPTPRGHAEAEAPDAPSVRASVAWPSALLVAPHQGETFFRSRRQQRGYAWVEPGMVISLRGGLRNGRVRAVTDGPLRIRGWMDVSSVGGVVLRRGRVRGTPLYLAPGDHVRLVDADGHTARIEASAHFGHPLARDSTAFVGNVPIDQLGAVMFGRGAGPTPGRPASIFRASRLHSRPHGDVVYSVPVLDPPLSATILVERGDWVGVRIGIGPYLVGYLPASSLRSASGAHKDVPTNPEVLDPWARPGSRRRHINPGVANPWTRDDAQADEEEDEVSTLPPRLRAAAVRPVRAVRAGTRVRVRGMVVAVFRLPGWAVELERDGGDVEILGAIDDRVTVRGIVRSGALFDL